MSQGLNKVILIGTLGQDPEIRRTNNGTAVCNFSIATNETWKDGDGQKQERTEWHRIVAWKGLAELCGQYLSKGREVAVVGRIQSKKYTDKQGVERTSFDIVADDVTFLAGGRKDGGGNQGGGSQSGSSGNQSAGWGGQSQGGGWGGGSQSGGAGWGNPNPSQGGGDKPIPF